MTKIMDGTMIADIVKLQLKKFKTKKSICIISVGDKDANRQYIKQKKALCAELGVPCHVFDFTAHDSDFLLAENEIISAIRGFNADSGVGGIIVQLPLPKGYNLSRVLNEISPEKDIDGITAHNLGVLCQGGKPFFVSATARGIMRLLDFYEVDCAGKNVVIVNDSIVVGKPLEMLFLGRGATVTLCNKNTVDLRRHCLGADILVSAVGKPNLIKGNMVKVGAVVVDAGFSVRDRVFFGDVDFVSVCKRASLVSPVPGGVGRVTVVSLLDGFFDYYSSL